jgi:hypothetical protein
VLEFVQTVRKTAREYEIEKENDVATFLDFTVMYGQDFPKSDWAKDILSCNELQGPAKMTILRHQVTETGVKL